MKAKILIVAGLLVMSGQQAAQAAENPLSDAFDKAAATYDVPRDLLVAVAYAESRLDGHAGEPSASGGYGVMHLVSNPATHTLEEAAKLTAKPVAELKSDDAANVLGGAAVLRAQADALGLSAAERKDAGAWYPTVAAYSHAAADDTAKIYADAVYETLAGGVDARGVRVRPQAVDPDLGEYAEAPRRLAAATDYPGARWVAANAAGYAVSDRPAGDAIDRIVIHVAQGTYAGTISWFQNPAARVASHYVVRSSDGQITQMVREKDRAFHAGEYNRRSVGIEHEGYVNNASWFTDQMYRASAALTRNIADRYGIPKNRTHIVGHVQVPGTDHTDPGPHWNWTTYMNYVTNGGGNPHTPEEVCGSGFKVIDSAALGTAGTVHLLYNTANGQNCVATMKLTSLGQATATSAYLEVQGSARKTDSGDFSYYAGPVKATAPGTCVKWGGKAGASAYDSPFEHCGG
ncbi:N-acetylmuramoyl-L-alanine amidase [Nonomuraea sp. ZG12]|uniref:N-acetylmuramoyl-L-alanine amidase n=1 Tax=Nonomuraea sp. ZG12 TaxID=3452207 RepID=UPI003F893CE4